MLKEKYFNFILPVWGEKYTKIFTDVCLPMILTSENLYAKTYTPNDCFTIVTTAESAALIKSSASFQKLSALISVKFILIDNLFDFKDVYNAASYCYELAMQQPYVIPQQTYFILLTPDSFWTEGTFKRLFEVASQDYQVVMAIGLRVNAEDMSHDLVQIMHQNDGLPVKNEQLLPFIFKNLHQLSRSHHFLSKDGFYNEWPSHLYWIDEPANQIIAHCFHMHPLMVQAPAKKTAIGKTIDAEFLNNLGYSTDTYYIFQQDYFGIELSPAARKWDYPLGKPSIKQIVKFSLINTQKIHQFFFTHRVIIGTKKTIEPSLEESINKLLVQIPCIRRSFFDRCRMQKPFIVLMKIPYVLGKIIEKPARLKKVLAYIGR